MEKMNVLKMDDVDLTNILSQVIREEIRSMLNEIREAEQDNTRVYLRIGKVSQFIRHFFLVRKVFPSIFPQWVYW